MNILTQIVVFIAEIVGIFILSRFSLQKSYPVLKKILKNDRLIVYLISLIYLPGTIIHEVSHYLAALILNLHPQEIRIFPVIEGRKVKLGHVLYEKNPHDFVRSLLVGIAPFLGALVSVWMIIQTKLFPGNAWWITILFGYLILTITANMFSSKQDLVDAGYLIPLGLIFVLLYYLFPIRLSPAFINQVVPPISYFIQTIQTPLLFSLGIHAILVVVLSRLK